MKKINIIMIILFVLFSWNSLAENSHTVKVWENTDECLVDCFTVYEVCAVTNDVDVRFIFDKVELDEKSLKPKGSVKKNVNFVQNKDYFVDQNYVRKGDCEKIRINGKKKPNENVDNIPIIDGIKHSEFIWWNSSWQNRIQLNYSGTSTGDGRVARMEISNLATFSSCYNKTSFTDLRITWENESYAEERGSFITPISANGTTGIGVLYINWTNKTGGNYFMYCNNSAVTTGNNGSKVFYFYDNALDGTTVSAKKWTKYTETTGAGATATITDEGNYFKLYTTATIHPSTATASITQNVTNYPAINNANLIFAIRRYTEGGSTQNGNAKIWKSITNGTSPEGRYADYFNTIYRIYAGAVITTTQAGQTGLWEQITKNGTTYFYNKTDEEWSSAQVNANKYAYFYNVVIKTGVGANSVSYQEFYWTGYGLYSGITFNIPDYGLTINEIYTDPVLEHTNQTYVLTLHRDFTNTTNSTWNLTMNGNANITFSIDGLTYNLTILSANTTEISFGTTRIVPLVISDTVTNISWNYNLNIPTYSGTIITNQTIVNIGLDNCSVFTIRAYNISIFDETTDSLLIGSIDGYFYLYNNVSGLYENFSITWDGDSEYGLCIYPGTTSYVVDAQFEYFAPGYETKNYYWDDVILDNTTDILNLYLTNGTSLITINVIDENDNRLEDAFVFIQSYDVGTNTYVTTEIVKTDFNGQGVAQMILYTQWYRFLVYYDGSLVLTTGIKKMLSTTLYLVVDLGTDSTATYDVVNDILCNTTFNNATNNFLFTFLNPSGELVNASLKIYKLSVYGETLINESSSFSASGTILLNIGLPSNTTYVAKCNITYDGQSFICGDFVSYNFGGNYRTFGSQGILLSFLLIVFLICVGIWSPVASIVLMMAGFFVLQVLGLFYLSPSILVSFIILGIIVLYKIARRE